MIISNGKLSLVFGYDVINGVLNVPSSVTSITNLPFIDEIKELKKVILPKNIKELGKYVFAGATLEEINLPDGLELMGNNAFNSTNIIEIIIPGSLKIIPEFAFNRCSELKTIVLNEGIESISFDSFSECAIEKIKLPNSLKIIGVNAFNRCKKLRKIEFGEKVEIIADSAFSNTRISVLNLPKSVKVIGENAFGNCFELKQATLNEGLTEIPNSCFSSCEKLESINIPQSVTRIGEYAFCGCAFVNLKLPSGIKEIKCYAFNGCERLEKVELNEGLVQLCEGAFEDCNNLKEVYLPSTLKIIKKDAFNCCTELNKIVFKEGLEEVEEGAFNVCLSLKSITFPNSLKTLNINGMDVEQISFNKNTKIIGEVSNPIFITKDGERFILSRNKINDSSFEFSGSYPSQIIEHWEDRELINRNIKASPFVEEAYKFLFNNLSTSEAKQFVKNHDIKFFAHFFNKYSQRIKLAWNYETETLYKMFYNLGGLEPKQKVKQTTKRGEEKVVEVYPAQKVTEFLCYIVDQSVLGSNSFKIFHEKFKNMTLDGYKPEFTNFLINKNNFLKLYLMMLKENIPSIFSSAYNYFEEIQETNRAHSGSNRKLKPTVEKFVDYFKKDKFAGVNESTKELAQVVGEYYSSQQFFDRAVGILKEKEKSGTGDNILSKPLKEEDVFESVNKMLQNIENLSKSTISILTEIANKEFTFEFLSKADPKNFVLGMLCDCCAHLDGAGYGIMRASIVHPSIQNLVIRNKNGRIIAKSTLYINEKEGYGVCNNVEVADGIEDSKKYVIYSKFRIALDQFANRYNKEHPQNPLKIITVGMSRNDLTDEIEADTKKSPYCYRAISYSKYGIDDNVHDGDSFDDQRIVWER